MSCARFTAMSLVALFLATAGGAGCSSGLGESEQTEPTPAQPSASPAASTDANDVAPPQPPDAVPNEPGRNITGLQLGSALYYMPTRGGFAAPHTALGTPGGVVYAIQSATGAWVDRVSFAFYVPSGADNLYRTGDYYGTVYWGGSGGTAHPWEYCPSGKGSVGLAGSHNGGYVTSIGMVCGDLITGSGWTWTTTWGTNGAYAFSDICNYGYLNTGFDVYSQTYLNAIGGACRASH